MIDPGSLVESVLRGVLGIRPKRSRGALRFLTGRRGGWMSNPNTLLTAAGVVWGIFETMNQPAPPTQTPAPAQAPPPVPPVSLFPTAVPKDALRMVRLAISAASADGAISDAERAAVMAQANASGGSELVGFELNQRRPLADIVSGVTDPAQRATLYVLAFTVIRADEQITGAERIYLAQLAHLLGLEPDEVKKLEADASQRIDALEK
ncbi:MAG: DUF533 domain-containing protein [Acidobacteria bacterium]|nr:DUF533 domain-containing protein [Acidobacteriota bacterium]